MGLDVFCRVDENESDENIYAILKFAILPQNERLKKALPVKINRKNSQNVSR